MGVMRAAVGIIFIGFISGLGEKVGQSGWRSAGFGSEADAVWERGGCGLGRGRSGENGGGADGWGEHLGLGDGPGRESGRSGAAGWTGAATWGPYQLGRQAHQGSH